MLSGFLLKLKEEKLALCGLLSSGDEQPQTRWASAMNRPGFAGEGLVQQLGCFFVGIQVFIESLVCFLRRDVSDGAVQVGRRIRCVSLGSASFGHAMAF